MSENNSQPPLQGAPVPPPPPPPPPPPAHASPQSAPAPSPQSAPAARFAATSQYAAQTQPLASANYWQAGQAPADTAASPSFAARQSRPQRSVLVPILVGVLALVVGLGGGYAIRMLTWDGTDGDEYKHLSERQLRTEQELNTALEERDQALEAVSAAEAERDDAIVRADAAEWEITDSDDMLQEARDSLEEKQAELDAAVDELKQLRDAQAEQETTSETE